MRSQIVATIETLMDTTVKISYPNNVPPLASGTTKNAKSKSMREYRPARPNIDMKNVFPKLIRWMRWASHVGQA